MTHEYGDPISPDGLEAAVRLTHELRARAPGVPLRDHAETAVRLSFCACVTEIEDAVEQGLSGTHAALVEEVARRAVEARGLAPGRKR